MAETAARTLVRWANRYYMIDSASALDRRIEMCKIVGAYEEHYSALVMEPLQLGQHTSRNKCCDASHLLGTYVGSSCSEEFITLVKQNYSTLHVV